MPGDADALFRTTVIRSTAVPEEISAGQGIGYFALVWAAGGGLSRNIVGGAGVLVDGIAAELGAKGGDRLRGDGGGPGRRRGHDR